LNQLQNITISAPSFSGLNTQDSPLGLDSTWASVADHCVIDQYGRIGSRKGINQLTASSAPLGSSNGIVSMFEFVDGSGNETIFSTGNNKIFSGTTTLTDETPGSYTVTGNDWKMVSLAGKCYFFQRDHEPLVYSTASGAVEAMTDVHGYSGTVQEGNEVLAAYGRLWVADITDDKQVVYWSDFLNGLVWHSGSSGSIDLAKHWPRGYDEIVALAAHNGYLIIFGKESILMYSGAESPSTMQLVDTTDSVGCIARDTVHAVGPDLLFLSSAGLRSLGRTIQEDSLPMADVSKNVRNELLSAIAAQSDGIIKAVYSPENAFYLLSLTDSSVVYCFDVRGLLENQSYRVTKWPSTELESFLRDRDGTLYLGVENGIAKYNGYDDEGASYTMRYFSHPLTFDAPANLKFLKKIRATIIGGNLATGNFRWGYDYKENYDSRPFVLGTSGIAEYNIGEYGISEYSVGVLTSRADVNVGGSGSVVTVGVEAVIEGSSLSLQELNIQSTIGRLI